MGSSARAFGRRQGVETLRCSSLIASLRSSALYAVTVVLVAASAIGGMPRPMNSAVAAELPERTVAPTTSAVAAVEPASRLPASTEVALKQADGATVNAVAAAESSESASSIEPTSFWAKTKRETTIWSGWDGKAQEFAKVAPDLTLQVIEFRGTRAYVYFPGDSKGHKAGEVWIDRADLQDMAWPRWARARRPDRPARRADLAQRSFCSSRAATTSRSTGEYRGRWAQAFYLLDHGPGRMGDRAGWTAST